MPLSKTKKETAIRLGQLLAQSTLDDKLKEKILNKLDELPEYLMLALLTVLEKENQRLGQVVSDIDDYFANQESRWQKVEEKQEIVAQKYLEEMTRRLNDEAEINNIKEGLDKQ